VPVRLPNDKSRSSGSTTRTPRIPIFTKGDYRVTISTGPATDSQRQAADDFVDGMVSNVQTLTPVLGPQRTLKLLAKSVKMKQLGPVGDEIVDLLDPPAPNGKDGKPIPPEMQALMGQVQQLHQQLQAAAQEIKQGTAKEQMKLEGQMAIERMKQEFEDRRAARDSETKITVAELGAKVDRLTLFLEERARLGMQQQEAHEAAKDRIHDVNMARHAAATQAAAADQAHEQALEQGQQGVEGQLAVQAAAPEPAGDGAAA
jgi:hypothetical protein